MQMHSTPLLPDGRPMPADTSIPVLPCSWLVVGPATVSMLGAASEQDRLVQGQSLCRKSVCFRCGASAASGLLCWHRSWWHHPADETTERVLLLQGHGKALVALRMTRLHGGEP